MCLCMYWRWVRRLTQEEIKKYFPVLLRSFTSSRVTEGLCDHKLTQEYRIPDRSALADFPAVDEIFFSFPLPKGSTVYEFVGEYFDEKGELIAEIHSEAKETLEAEESYVQAKANGHTAQLMKKVKEVFEISMGALPDECRTVKVSFSFTLEMPLHRGSQNHTIFVPLAVTPKNRNPTRYNYAYVSEKETCYAVTTLDTEVSAEAILNFQSPIQAIQSDTHPVSSKLFVDGDMGKAIVSIGNDTDATKQYKPSKFFVLQVEQAKTKLEPKIFIQEKMKKSDVYEEFSGGKNVVAAEFFLPVQSFPEIKHKKEVKRNFFFLVDRSDSMKGPAMENCKKALNLLLSGLPETSNFNICSFGSHCSFLFPKQCAAYNDEHLTKARTLVDRMGAEFGGTKLIEPLTKIITMHREMSKKHYNSREVKRSGINMESTVFLLTDGEVANTEEVVDLVKEASNEFGVKLRFFTCGIGNDVSKVLVENVAFAGNGTSVFLRKDERMNTKLSEQMDTAMSELATGLRIEFPADSIEPFEHSLLKKGSLGNVTKSLCFYPGMNVRFKTLISMLDQEKLRSTEDEVLVRCYCKRESDEEAFVLAEIKSSQIVVVEANLLVPLIKSEIAEVEEKAARADAPRKPGYKPAKGPNKSEKKRTAQLSMLANIPSCVTSLVGISDRKLREAAEEEKPQVVFIGNPWFKPYVQPGVPGGIIYGFRGPNVRAGGGPMGQQMKTKKKRKKGASMSSSKPSRARELVPMAPSFLNGSVGVPNPSYPEDESDDDYDDFEMAMSPESKEKIDEQEEEKFKEIIDEKKYEQLDAIVAVQNPDGSFELAAEKKNKIIEVIGLPEESVGSDKGILTAIVVVFLEVKLSELATEWKRVHAKAQEWIAKAANDGSFTEEEMYSRAKDIISGL